MANSSVLHKSGQWLFRHLGYFEIALVVIEMILLTLVNFWRAPFQIIALPLGLLALLYYLVSFAFTPSEPAQVTSKISQKFTFFLLCLGVVAIVIEIIKQEAFTILLVAAALKLLWMVFLILRRTQFDPGFLPLAIIRLAILLAAESLVLWLLYL